jgi:hypothetical protein
LIIVGDAFDSAISNASITKSVVNCSDIVHDNTYLEYQSRITVSYIHPPFSLT